MMNTEEFLIAVDDDEKQLREIQAGGEKSGNFTDAIETADEINQTEDISANRGDEGILEGVIIKDSDEILSESEDDEVRQLMTLFSHFKSNAVSRMMVSSLSLGSLQAFLSGSKIHMHEVSNSCFAQSYFGHSIKICRSPHIRASFFSQHALGWPRRPFRGARSATRHQ